MNLNKTTILLLFALNIFSCSTPINETEFKKAGYKVIRFIPSMDNKYLNGTEAYINEFINHLNIYPITNGFDSIQYRLWISDNDVCSRCYSAENLLLIKKPKTGPWKAISAQFGMGDMKKDPYKIICKEIKEIEPENWNNLLQSINNLNVNNWCGSTFFSKDQYQGGSSTNFIILEIATTNQYRLITHYAPRQIICEEKECKELRAFLNLVSKQFNLPKYRHYVGD